MRVSERQKYWITDRRINKARSDNVQTLNKLSTQKRINALRDDPIGVARVIKLEESLADINNYKANVDYTKGFLDVTETAISSIHDRLSRAYELAMAMANDTYDATSRDSTAMEVKELIDQVILLGNSRYNGKYVFSGFRTLSPALDREGNYLGDDGSIYLQVGSEHFKKINVSGRDFFQASLDERQEGHFNMLDSLYLLEDGLKLNDKDAIYRAIDEINHQMEKTTSFQADVGAVWNSLDQAAKRLEFDETQKIARVSEIEDLDLFKASSDFKRTESVLQSTLLASNKMLQPSLLNFMQ